MSASPNPRPSRREFLRHLGGGVAACAVGGSLPRALGLESGANAHAALATDEPRALIVIQLAGGHDGLSTFAPYANDEYHRLRPTLRLTRSEIIRLDAMNGLNRAGRALEPLFKDGLLAVVPGVGFTPASPSHYRSTEIWHTGSGAEELWRTGWIGRCRNALAAQHRREAAWHGPDAPPRMFVCEQTNAASRRGAPAAGPDLWSTPRPLSTPDFSTQLSEIAERACSRGSARSGVEFYFVSLDGFDGHFDLRPAHDARLATLATSLFALQRRLEQRGVANRVLTFVFSELGRSAAENAQGGADHAAAGQAYLLGASVRGGFHGENTLAVGRAHVDCRRILSTVTEQWLGVSSRPILSGDFPALPLLRRSACEIPTSLSCA